MNVTFELKSLHQKSFYGKASVLKTNEGYYLDSYNRRIAVFIDGHFECVKNKKLLTRTTLKHINAFRVFCGLNPQTKKELLES